MDHWAPLHYLSLLAIILIAGVNSHAHAYPGNVQFMKSKPIVIEREDITLSLNKITVSYVFDNTSALDRIETMVFPISSEPDGATQMQQLNLTVNGRQVEYKTMHLPVSFHGHDISEFLSQVNLPFDPVDFNAIFNPQLENFSNIKQQLLDQALLDPYTLTPRWTIKSFYYWQQLFPAAKQVHLRQTYQPFVKTFQNYIKDVPPPTPVKQVPEEIGAFDRFLDAITRKKPDIILTTEQKNQQMDNFLVNLDHYNAHLKQYCPSTKDYENLFQALQEKKPSTPNQPKVLGLVSKEYGFQLTQDNNWAGPIKHFTLRIKHPEEFQPMLCWPQAFERLNASTLMFEAENFVPIQDIHLLLLGHGQLIQN